MLKKDKTVNSKEKYSLAMSFTAYTEIQTTIMPMSKQETKHSRKIKFWKHNELTNVHHLMHQKKIWNNWRENGELRLG